MAHLLISAAHKSSGKTVISLGISAVLHKRGLSVQTFKKGPDYIDPMWLSKASQRNCYNLDFWTQTDEQIQSMFMHQGHDVDISIIEGNKGLHDGLAADGGNSNAALAKLLKAPVILVLDTRGTIRGVAPLLLGYQQFDRDVNIAGVILNFVGGNRHAAKLKTVIEKYTDIPILGMVKQSSELELVERYLGLMPSNEDQHAQEKIKTIADYLDDQINFDQLIKIANKSPSLSFSYPSEKNIIKHNLKIAYAKDEAFGFYYADDLDTFSQLGVELLPFDTLNDTKLPNADALFIGGGFPEKRMQKLSANTAMKQSIYDAIQQGLPCYAECGGLMYLSRSISYASQKSEMVGIIQADIEMFEKPIGRGYTLLQKTAQHPWPNVSKQPISGHEFHYSKLINISSDTKFAFEVKRGFGVDRQHDGILYKNLLACYAHQRNTPQNTWVSSFIEFIKNRA